MNPQLASKLRRMLIVLDRGKGPSALNMPGYRLHPLKGGRSGQWAATVSGNWRLVSDFEGENATNVDSSTITERGKIMEMHNPPHPGQIVREDCLEPLSLTVTAAAEWLGVSRQTLSELLNGHNGLTAEMAIRLEKAGWSNAETWLGIQLAYDLWQAKQHAGAITVKPYLAPLAPAPT